MPAKEITVLSTDGHRSKLRLHEAKGSGEGLLFLPALGVAAHKYDGFGQAMAAAGVTCAVHEWRGHGSSSLRASRRVDWGYRELLQQDLPAAVQALAGSGSAPRWRVGGHSLGGQIAAMAAAQDPHRFPGLLLLATGVPHYTTFRGRQRWGVALFASMLPLLTRVVGHYPGERLGFAAREAGRLMRDWAASARSGRYADYGGAPMEAALSRYDQPVLALRLSRDWLVPSDSLEALLAKLGRGPHQRETLDDARLGTTADHFRWMRTPAAVAARIADWMRLSP
ncbi:alpha/beta fold hydrolase [Arenimonas sp. MALMAid1274]|uniref:alpha/beta hydrolase family protein n=1 Tax=Arenimonas sp. MALMAid1274 TaxID=3411630 RepID=UPI003BA27D2E